MTIWRRTELISFPQLPIVIGDNTFINHSCTISPNVSVGKNVDVGPGVSLITDSHEIGSNNKRAGAVTFLPIVIGDGCWIGANATILGGVSIGNGTIIAAGAVVTTNCSADCLYGGVPAKLIKKLD